jgi:regulator of cell morphogenesis and NO signaling
VSTAPTLGSLIVAQPEAAMLFERLGLDYCCGGNRTLDEACRQKGLDAKTVNALLQALAHEPRDARLAAHDVARTTITELCDHIVARHHDPLRRELPRISDLLATVVRVHGKDHPDLHDLQRLFAGTREELEEHLRTEEATVFPACRALDDGEPDATVDPDVLALLEDDHAHTGDVLIALRELAGGYRTEAALCGTHRTLLKALRAFELDMHQHIHEENNVLFGRVRDRIGGA